jgi:hypothetical protein
MYRQQGHQQQQVFELQKGRQQKQTYQEHHSQVTAAGAPATTGILATEGRQQQQKCVVSLCYSPCDETPTAATAAVMTDRVSLRRCTARARSKETNIKIWCKLIVIVHLSLEPRCMVAVGVSSHGL